MPQFALSRLLYGSALVVVWLSLENQLSLATNGALLQEGSENAEDVQEHLDCAAPLFASRNNVLVTGNPFKREVRLWDVANGRLKAAIQSKRRPIGAIAFSPCARTLVIAREGGLEFGQVELHEISGTTTLFAHPGGVACIAFSSDGKLMAAGGYEGFLEVWNLESRERVAKFDEQGVVTAIALSGDAKLIAAGNSRGKLRVWQVSTRKAVSTFTGPEDCPIVLRFTGDDRQLVAGSQDGTLRFWDLQMGKEVRCIKDLKVSYAAISLSPDTKLAAVGREDGSLHLLDLDTGKDVWTVKAHPTELLTVAFSPDGKKLASSSRGNSKTRGEVKIWDVEKKELLTTLKAEHVDR